MVKLVVGMGQIVRLEGPRLSLGKCQSARKTLRWTHRWKRRPSHGGRPSCTQLTREQEGLEKQRVKGFRRMLERFSEVASELGLRG